MRIRMSKAIELMEKSEHDIAQFNRTIKSMVQELTANGEKTEDLFAHLTQAYKAVPQDEFKNYITSKIDLHDDGTASLTPNELMTKAKTKCDEMTEVNTWNLAKPSKADAHLVALQAQLQQIRQDCKQMRVKVGCPHQTRH